MAITTNAATENLEKAQDFFKKAEDLSTKLNKSNFQRSEFDFYKKHGKGITKKFSGRFFDMKL